MSDQSPRHDQRTTRDANVKQSSGAYKRASSTGSISERSARRVKRAQKRENDWPIQEWESDDGANATETEPDPESDQDGESDQDDIEEHFAIYSKRLNEAQSSFQKQQAALTLAESAVIDLSAAIDHAEVAKDAAVRAAEIPSTNLCDKKEIVCAIEDLIDEYGDAIPVGIFDVLRDANEAVELAGLRVMEATDEVSERDDALKTAIRSKSLKDIAITKIKESIKDAEKEIAEHELGQRACGLMMAINQKGLDGILALGREVIDDLTAKFCSGEGEAED
ncbi:hypothetical protein FLONG3_7872 [Fusarium longipes]|uniref:Uncharacterized protein n=1 Tax=Fusarium longipes TaxID=694270 RepID=A0A395S9Z1_9HYPO|nr:hypothetical protein FLONG3_7872 [Fusarium longipes]